MNLKQTRLATINVEKLTRFYEQVTRATATVLGGSYVEFQHSPCGGIAISGIAAIRSYGANIAEAAAHALRAASANKHVHFEQADLSLMRHVAALAAKITTQWPSPHYLVLSAGIVRGRRVLTDEGVESNFTITCLGRFLLTRLLLPALARVGARDAASRILIIGGAARDGVVHYSDVNLTRNFSTLATAGQFCGAEDIFVVEQDRRIRASGWADMVSVTTLKVGAVRTNIRKQFPLWMKVVIPLLIDPLITVSPGAIVVSAEHLLLAPEFEARSGALFAQIKRMKPANPGRRTGDPREGSRLRELSERLAAEALATHA